MFMYVFLTMSIYAFFLQAMTLLFLEILVQQKSPHCKTNTTSCVINLKREEYALTAEKDFMGAQ